MDIDVERGGSALAAFARRHSVLTVWMIGLLLYAVDFQIKRIPLWREPINVWIAADEVVPFAPDWAYVYIYGWLVLLFAMAGWYVWENRRNWGRVRALVIAAVVMQVSGWIAHYAVPTYFPRPEVAPELMEAGHLIWVIYSTDPPTHVLPSLHMASIMVAAWFFCRHGARARLIVGVGAVLLISLSVMYTKQHGFVDVVVGIPWGWMACLAGVAISHRLARKHAEARRATAHRRQEVAASHAGMVPAGGDGAPSTRTGVPTEREQVS